MPSVYLDGPQRSEQAEALLRRYEAAEDADEARELAGSVPEIGRMVIALASGETRDEVVTWDIFDWRLANWGTKSSPSSDRVDLQVADDGRSLSYEFWTAWAPPTPLVRTLAARFPDLRFELLYSESDGGWYGGRLLAVEGAVAEEFETDDPEIVIALLRDAEWEAEAEAWERS